MTLNYINDQLQTNFTQSGFLIDYAGIQNINMRLYENHINRTFDILKNYNILNSYYTNNISSITTLEKNLIFKVFSNINQKNPSIALENLSDFFYNVNGTLNSPTVFFIFRISREIEYINSLADEHQNYSLIAKELNSTQNFNSYIQFCITMDPLFRQQSLVRMTCFLQNHINITGESLINQKNLLKTNQDHEIRTNCVFLENQHKSLIQTKKSLLKNEKIILEKFNYEKDKKFAYELSTAIDREIKQIKNDPQKFQEKSVQNFFVKNFEEKTKVKIEPQIKETTSFLGRTINCFTRTLSFLKFW